MASLGVRAVPIGRIPLLLIFGLLGLAIGGWVFTGNRMAGMDAGPATDLGTLGFFMTTWVVMMAAMMFPSAAPMVIVYDRIRTKRRELGKTAPAAGSALFVGGYLASWAAFGLVGWLLYQAAAELSIGILAWDRGGRYLAGGVILLAAVYELTPLKHACLRKCRSPLAFLLGGWRDGSFGAFRLGVEHGAWCVGCCWALMAALFALGVMSIAWMALVAALIAAEKLLPRARTASLAVTVLLAMLAVSVALAPDRVPGLVLPNSPKAQAAQMMMRGGTMKGDMTPGSMQGTTERGPMRDRGASPSRAGMAPAQPRKK